MELDAGKGYRVFARRRDGSAAAVFDGLGVGSASHPSGRDALLTDSSGGGMLLNADGSVLRTWSSDGAIVDGGATLTMRNLGFLLAYC